MQRRTALWLSVLVPLVPIDASAAADPNDADFALQWGLRNTGQTVDGQPGTPGADVRATAVWDIHSGTSSVIVAIVGRGIDPHPEFADRLLEGYATVGDPYDTRDSCPHDTHLAGIIAAATNNGVGIAGLNGRARLVPVRVLDGCGGTEADVAEGIVWAVDHGADVILAAVHFATGTQSLADAVAYAVSHDVLVIAPVGSAGTSDAAFPAAFAGCLGVAATTNQDTISPNSNFGPAVDLAAPGQGIWSTWTDGGYAYQPNGRDTASAAAFVTGVAALIRSYAPQLSAAAVAQILIASADDRGAPGWDEQYGAGRLNAQRALESTPLPALRFEHLDPFPALIPPDTSSSFLGRIADGAEAVRWNHAMSIYRIDGDQFAATPLHPVGNGLFEAELPVVSCGSILEYWLTAVGSGGTSVTDPLDAPDRLHSAGAAYMEVIFEDDFESDLGWEAEGGDNTSGRWSRVDPVGTSAQPEYDRSPGVGQYCYVTGQHTGGSDGSNDVDGGPVRLTSPVISLGAADDAEVTYAHWFHSTLGTEDFLTVEVSRDGGSTWATAETVASTHAWIAHAFHLSELPALTGSQLRVRFSTADSPSDSLTEAAVDDFAVRAIRCSIIPGDVNHDGFVDRTDAARLRECWTGPDRPSERDVCDIVDFDHNYHVDLRDWGVFQRAFDPR